MAKSQKKSNREIRKPKAEKPRTQNASNPSQKLGIGEVFANKNKYRSHGKEQSVSKTSAFCRAQEALQRDRAAHAELENVRTIANIAATAWAREASLAEKHESRQERGEKSTLPTAASPSEEMED